MEEEHHYTDDGEDITCPICGAMWLKDDEDGEFTSGTCEHLRFTLNSDCGEAFDFFNEWDAESFLEAVEDACNKDEDFDILNILGEIQNPDVNRAIFHQWEEDPLNHPWTVWGYKEN